MRLIVLEIPQPAFGSPVGTVFDLNDQPEKSVLVIGRNSDNDIVLLDSSVSRQHLEIQILKDVLLVRDLNSTNGTSINNCPLIPQIHFRLEPGSKLKLGDVVLGVEVEAWPELPQGEKARTPIPAATPAPLINHSAQEPPMLLPPAVIELQSGRLAPTISKKAKGRTINKIEKTDKAATVVFPSFVQRQSRIPHWVWQMFRFVSITLALALCIMNFVVPELGLLVFWGFFVPLLPMVFFIAPGLWRNICPMAALNQLPRRGRFTQALKLPRWLKEYSYVIAIGLFVTVVSTRKLLFNQNGPALGMLMAVALGTAFLMGIIFKGKSGWCSSICPLLPVQRLYGQTPWVLVGHSHCQPCIGCTKNCYDLNPAVARVAGMHSPDAHYPNSSKFFAGGFPGMILAFYWVPDPPVISVAQMYLEFVFYILVSLGVFFGLSALLKVSAIKLTPASAALAFNLYYWFNIPILISKIEWLTARSMPEWSNWTACGLSLAVTVVWLKRTYYKNSFLSAKIQRIHSSKSVANKANEQ